MTYLNGIVHSHRKTENVFFFTTIDVRCVHRGWHGTHRYDIQALATHGSAWVHRYSSLLQWSVPLVQRGAVGGSFAYFARNARCTVTTDLLVWYSNKQNDFSPGAAIFAVHTLTSPSGRNVNYNEKQLTGKFFFFSCSFYLYRFRKYMSYGFPIITFCKPGAHYETPCWLCQKRDSVSQLHLISSGNHFKVFRCANHCQSQLKTPQSLSVLLLLRVTYSIYE